MSGWNYGLEKPDENGRKMMLDITDDITGETHREARENISMYGKFFDFHSISIN